MCGTRCGRSLQSSVCKTTRPATIVAIGRAAECAAVERRVARFAGGFGRAKRPGVVGRENREVGRLARRDFAFDAENARRARGK